MPAQRRRAVERQRAALGDRQLQPTRSRPVTHSVTGCSTCSRVFISRKKNSPAGASEELDRAGADVADRAGGRDRRVAAAGPAARRRPPATASPRRSSGAGAGSSTPARRAPPRCRAVGDDLDLDVPGRVSTYRSQNTVPSPNADAASRRAAATASARDSAVPHDAHAPPAAAGGRLDQHRERVDLRRARPTVGSIGTPASASSAFASSLEPIIAIAFGGGPTQVSPASITARGEVGVLGQEAVAGVHRVRAAPAGRLDEQVAAQVRVGRRVARQVHGVVGLGDVRRVGVGVGVDRDRLDAHRPAGGEHPPGDLAPVGDQQPSDHVARRSQSGRRRSWSVLARVCWHQRTGTCRARCGCRGGRSRRRRRAGRTGTAPPTPARSCARP